jgi:sulfotransferase
MMRGLGDRLCLVEFDDLTHNPKETLEDIYKFLELPNFEHDFTSVEQYTHEDDSVHGMDLHTIRKDVKPIKDDSASVLGVDLCKQYNGTEFWRK